MILDSACIRYHIANDPDVLVNANLSQIVYGDNEWAGLCRLHPIRAV